MNNKPKSLNLFIKNYDNKKNKSNIYKSNIISDKFIKNNEYILSLKKAINPIFSNKKNTNTNTKQVEIIKPKANNLFANYLLSSNNKASSLAFNNEIKNHVSLGDLINNKKDNPLKIKPKIKNIYNNKSESKLNVLTNNNKILPLNTFKNINTINHSKVYQNNSDNFFPILSTQSKKLIKKENDFNINSTGNIYNKKKSIRFNLIGNNMLKNNPLKTNIILSNNDNTLTSKKEFSQSPSSMIINPKKFIDNKSNSNGSKKQMIKIFSDSKMKNKNKLTFKKLSLMLISPLYMHSDNNNNQNNKEIQNKYKTPEYTLNENKKFILNINKNIDKNKINQGNAKSNISLKFKNKMYNLTTNNNQKSLINNLNLKLVIDKTNDKEKNNQNKNEIKPNDIKDIKDTNINNIKIENDSNICNKEIIKQTEPKISNEQENDAIEHNNINNSKISNSNSSIYDFNYYMNESNKLSEYIKQFYKQNNTYPDSKIEYYKIGRKIGQGAFGKVNIGLHILTGRVVAIKSFKKENCNSEKINKIINERNLMKELDHKNIIRILDYFEDKNYIFIIMEYINGGNLYSLIKKRRKLQEKMAKYIFKQMISALKYIHSHNIAHRDIKLDNILLDLYNGIKICDFGIGKKLNSPDQLLTSFSGTPIYMAPEIILSEKNKGYKGFPVDVWSSGIALYIMLSGQLPFKNNKNNKNKKNKNKELEYSIVNKEPKELENISDKAKDLIKGLLCKDPSKRLTCDEILKHPWLKNEDFKSENMLSHLFTKNEIIMLSKTYIDYRKDKNENFKEYFNISNLYDDNSNINEDIKNNRSKSVILTPFNTMLSSENDNTNSIDKDNSLDNINNKIIKIENDVLEIGNKVKEHYRLYELNNNKEIDNGIMIYSQLNSNSLYNSIQSKDNSLIHNINNDMNKDDNLKDKLKNKNKTKDDDKIDNILKQLEYFGYNREYILKCLKHNELNYATASYYLMKNYDDMN